MAGLRETTPGSSDRHEEIAFIDQVFDGSLPVFSGVSGANLSGEPFRYRRRTYSVMQTKMVHGTMIIGESFSPVDRVGESIRVVRGDLTLFSYYKVRSGLIEAADVNTPLAARRIRKFFGL